MYTGYRILSSKDAIEFFYKKALLRSVKVSPENKELFISEIKKRCPRVKVHDLIF
ncbi:PH domain-containing protein [Cytobacillus oceanisediminis]|nr:PH domain-containing protein [Cytobacillus oceanisediminis]